MNDSFNSWAGDRVFKGLILAVLAFAIIALAAYANFAFKQARYVYSGPTTISVRGTGEATRVPDIATFTFGVEAQAQTPAEAQTQSAEHLNDILSFLSEQDVAEEDVKTTSYNLYPRYEYTREVCAVGTTCSSGRSELVGYTASQMVEVKVRDTDAAGELIAGAGERGATNISGVRFTVDDDDAAKAEAREAAIQDAREKAKKLAKSLDTRIVKLIGFWEESEVYPYAEARAFGGAVEDAALSVAPSLPVGENTVTADTGTASVSRGARLPRDFRSRNTSRASSAACVPGGYSTMRVADSTGTELLFVTAISSSSVSPPATASGASTATEMFEPEIVF
jgi:uncharacterized protein YggE